MNYIEWKYKLQVEIALMQQSERDTIIAYYDELFYDKTQEGYSEKEILKAFGAPKSVAEELTCGLGTLETTPETEASRKEKFKENFEKFQENFNTKVNGMLASLGKSIKKFASYVGGKLDQLDEYHKSKKKDDE